MTKLLYLFLGGGIGTISRYFISGTMQSLLGARFPYGTLIVNLLGCFLIGLLTVVLDQKFQMAPNLRLIVIVGFLGAFTTFSTFIFETANLIRDGQSLTAFLNVAVSVVIGFTVFRMGVLLGQQI